MRSIERWCGIECTVNRVGDRYSDQVVLSGHHERAGDLDLVAELGFAAIRYPVLWERISPDAPDCAEWSWSDDRLARLQRLGMRVIAGLTHHGSGPRYTDLLSETFAPGLTRHATAVAQRYPWITDWTPVNEPVTTARFSALYGHWYPHARDERSFWLALLNQVDATRLSMHAVRQVNPAARLIQTEDLGFTWATEPLADQAAFNNQRRWAGWDLLCGWVKPGHPLWHRLCGWGLGERLRRIADDPCPPDVIGINHYPTSDRFLDHRIQLYAGHDQGGHDAARTYVDVPAVRAIDPAPQPFRHALRETWERYRLPLALTEVHVGCTREEQMRWASDAWTAATDARDAGVDVRGVTAWAVLGSRNWDTLVTREGAYEPGLFDVREGAPRATGLARHWSTLSGERATPPHPVATQRGWWRRPGRILHPRMRRATAVAAHVEPDVAPARPLLICGANGTLGQALARSCGARGIAHHSAGRAECDVLDPAAIERTVATVRPWAVINATGWVRVDEAEQHADACDALNHRAAGQLARACAARSIPLVAISTDLVFNGNGSDVHGEEDTPDPVNAYGRSKAAMERAVLAHGHQALIVRAAAFFSPYDRYNFAVAVADALDRGDIFEAADDQVVSPSYVPALADAILTLAVDGETGVRHLVNDAACTWAEFARLIASALGHDPERIVPVPGERCGWTAPRPRSSALATRDGGSLGPIASAVHDFATVWRQRHAGEQ